MVNIENLKLSSLGWVDKRPFPFFWVDNFFTEQHALLLEKEFFHFDDPNWHSVVVY